MRRRFLIFVVLTLLLAMVAACGTGDAEEDDLSVDFSAFDEPEVVKVEETYTQLPGKQMRLLRVSYLSAMIHMLNDLKQNNRDLLRMAEREPETVNLGWVVDVHLLTESLDDVLIRAVDLEVPDYMEEDFVFHHGEFLEGVQTLGYGSNRLLASSIVVGPSGRTLSNMRGDERHTFLRFLEEARFFLNDANVLLSRSQSEYRSALSRMQLQDE